MEDLSHCEMAHELLEYKQNTLIDHIRILTEAEEKNTEFRQRTEGAQSAWKGTGITAQSMIATLLSLISLGITLYLNFAR